MKMREGMRGATGGREQSGNLNRHQGEREVCGSGLKSLILYGRYLTIQIDSAGEWAMKDRGGDGSG